MKTRRIVLFALLTTLVWGGLSNDVKAQQVSVNFSLFYNELGHYGRWVNNPHYGQVWVYSEPGFRPYYSAGHWDYTDYGWSWVSNYDWGWAPFHYGRWEEDPYYGWMWIPGYDWAPAWVSWSEYDGYYGWAPMGYGVNVNVNFGAIPYNRWVFVPRQRICEYNVYNYYVQPKNQYFRNAVIINNYNNYNGGNRYWAGPRRNEVERYTQRPIQSRTPQWGRGNVGARNDDHGWTNRDNRQNDRDRAGVGDRNQNNNDWNNRSQSNPRQNDGDRRGFDRNQQNNDWNNRNQSIPRQNQGEYPRNNNANNNGNNGNGNGNGRNNNRPLPVQQERQWDNRPGRPDQNITRGNYPQQQNPSRNYGQSGNNNPRPVMPNRQPVIGSNSAPRAFGNHNNGVMRTSPGNSQGGHDIRGNGNGRQK